MRIKADNMVEDVNGKTCTRLDCADDGLIVFPNREPSAGTLSSNMVVKVQTHSTQ